MKMQIFVGCDGAEVDNARIRWPDAEIIRLRRIGDDGRLIPTWLEQMQGRSVLVVSTLEAEPLTEAILCLAFRPSVVLIRLEPEGMNVIRRPNGEDPEWSAFWNQYP